MKALYTLILLACVHVGISQNVPLERLLRVGSMYTVIIESNHTLKGTVVSVDSEDVVIKTMSGREVRLGLIRISQVVDENRRIFIYPPEIYGDSVAHVPVVPVQLKKPDIYIPDSLVRLGRNTFYGSFGISALYVGYFTTLTYEFKPYVSKNRDHNLEFHGGFGVCGSWNQGDFDVLYGGVGYAYRFSKIRLPHNFFNLYLETHAEVAYLHNGSFTDARDHYFPMFEWGIRGDFQNWGPMFHATLNSTLGASVGLGFRF